MRPQILVVLCCFYLTVTTTTAGRIPKPRSTSSSQGSDQVTFEIREASPPGSVVGRITTKSGFTYRFVEAPAEFNLDPETGVIRCSTTPTDREVRDKYNLLILSSAPTYPIEVRIKILDINDNAPYWPHYVTLNVSFSESASVGAKVTLHTAKDRDEGGLTYAIAGGGVLDRDHYSLMRGDAVSPAYRTVPLPFKLNHDSTSDVLTLEVVRYLDRELEAEYLVNISVTDSGNLRAYLPIKVYILDVNDNPPAFDEKEYYVNLNETVGEGVPILQVSATDADEEGSKNAAVNFFLDDDQVYFRIDPDTGIVYTASPTPIECTTAAYNNNLGPLPRLDEDNVCVFPVYARDLGSPSQTSTTYVTVTFLSNLMNHAPSIQVRSFIPGQEDEISLDEMIAAGSVVAAVSVADPDSGFNGVTSLSIIAGNEGGAFRLDSIADSYLIRTRGTLNRDAVSRYNLSLLAADSGTPQLSSMTYLVINVVPSANQIGWLDAVVGGHGQGQNNLSVGVIVMIVFFIILIAVLSTSFFGFLWQKRLREQRASSVATSRTLSTHLTPPKKMFNHPPPPPPVTSIYGQHAHHQQGSMMKMQQQAMVPPRPNKMYSPQMYSQLPPNQGGAINLGSLGITGNPPSYPQVMSASNPLRQSTNRIPSRASIIPPPAIPSSEANYSDLIVSASMAGTNDAHYDIENSSSIAAGSDFDLMMRYKIAHQRTNSNLTNSNVGKIGHAPLTRLSPSASETTAPRILTLKDLTQIHHARSGSGSGLTGRPPMPNPRGLIGATPTLTTQHGSSPRHDSPSENGDTATDVDSFTSSEFDDNGPHIHHNGHNPILSHHKRPW